MSWLNMFNKPEPVYAAPEAKEMYEPVAFDTKGYRVGSWVVTPEGVGVLTAQGVALANEDGTNKMAIVDGKAVVHVVDTLLRQAYLEEIPASRRPDHLMNAMLGYKEAA